MPPSPQIVVVVLLSAASPPTLLSIVPGHVMAYCIVQISRFGKLYFNDTL